MERMQILYLIWRPRCVVARLNLPTHIKVRRCSLNFVIQLSCKSGLLRDFQRGNVNHSASYCAISLIFGRGRKLSRLVQLNFRQRRIVPLLEARLYRAFVFYVFRIRCYRRLRWLLVRPLFSIIQSSVFQNWTEVLWILVMAHYLRHFVSKELARIARTHRALFRIGRIHIAMPVQYIRKLQSFFDDVAWYSFGGKLVLWGRGRAFGARLFIIVATLLSCVFLVEFLPRVFVKLTQVIE